MNKTIKALAAKYPKKIADLSFEQAMDDGIWIYLQPFWINEMTQTHNIHEYTVKECLYMFRNFVVPCSCDGCYREQEYLERK